MLFIGRPEVTIEGPDQSSDYFPNLFRISFWLPISNIRTPGRALCRLSMNFLVASIPSWPADSELNSMRPMTSYLANSMTGPDRLKL